MRRHWEYLKYVLRHKWYVFLACMRLGVPIWIAIRHDWDKFLPDEWLPYARCFYKPDGTKQYDETIHFARAWMLHQHRNKHHWQYWVWIGVPSHNTAIPLPETDYLIWDRGEAQRVIKRQWDEAVWYELYPLTHGDYIGDSEPMPDVYRREMVADWIGAGRAMGKPKTWEWYTANKDKMQLHPETRRWVEDQMERLEWDARQASVGSAA